MNKCRVLIQPLSLKAKLGTENKRLGVLMDIRVRAIMSCPTSILKFNSFRKSVKKTILGTSRWYISTFHFLLFASGALCMNISKLWL